MTPIRLVSMPVVLACLAGCASSTLPDNYLTERWGGENVEIVASATLVQLFGPCLRADFSGPVAIAADGSFSAEGAIATASFPGMIGLRSRIVGKVEGDVITLQFGLGGSPGEWNEDPTPTELHRGVAPHWGSGGCIQ